MTQLERDLILAQQYACLTIAAEAVWDMQKAMKEDGTFIGEETLTDFLIYSLKRNWPGGAETYKFTKAREARSGADWAWIIISACGTRILVLVIQAKILDRSESRYKELPRRIGSSAVRQIDRLIEYANRRGFMPMYMFYNHFQKRDVIAGDEGITIANAYITRAMLDAPLWGVRGNWLRSFERAGIAEYRCRPLPSWSWALIGEGNPSPPTASSPALPSSERRHKQLRAKADDSFQSHRTISVPLRYIAEESEIETAPDRAWRALTARWRRESAVLEAMGLDVLGEGPCDRTVSPDAASGSFKGCDHSAIGSIIASLRDDDIPISRVLITQEQSLRVDD